MVPAHCRVVAPADIHAARRAAVAALGVAQHDDAALLGNAGAGPVVTNLDAVAIAALPHGKLCALMH